MMVEGLQGLGLNCYEAEWGEGVRCTEGYSSTSLLSDKAANQKESFKVQRQSLWYTLVKILF